jgi:acetyl-CoA C-acetyltransferase
VDPVDMLTGPMAATGSVLKRAGMTIKDIDLVENNEAFASVVLAWLREFDVDPAVVNPMGERSPWATPSDAPARR